MVEVPAGTPICNEEFFALFQHINPHTPHRVAGVLLRLGIYAGHTLDMEERAVLYDLTFAFQQIETVHNIGH